MYNATIFRGFASHKNLSTQQTAEEKRSSVNGTWNIFPTSFIVVFLPNSHSHKHTRINVCPVRSRAEICRLSSNGMPCGSPTEMNRMLIFSIEYQHIVCFYPSVLLEENQLHAADMYTVEFFGDQNVHGRIDQNSWFCFLLSISVLGSGERVGRKTKTTEKNSSSQLQWPKNRFCFFLSFQKSQETYTNTGLSLYI